MKNMIWLLVLIIGITGCDQPTSKQNTHTTLPKRADHWVCDVPKAVLEKRTALYAQTIKDCMNAKNGSKTADWSDGENHAKVCVQAARPILELDRDQYCAWDSNWFSYGDGMPGYPCSSAETIEEKKVCGLWKPEPTEPKE